jgi:hypothetical protein
VIEWGNPVDLCHRYGKLELVDAVGEPERTVVTAGSFPAAVPRVGVPSQ